MNKNEIKAMIEQYNITDFRDGRIRVGNAKNITAKIKEKILAAKPEILAHFAQEREEARKAYEKKMATFDSIPGVPELREIRQEWQQYNREFNAAFERGDGRFPAVPQVKESDVASKYPSAVFALQVEYELGRSNLELYGIAENAYDALCEGKPWREVKAQYEKAKEKFVQRHIWD